MLRTLINKILLVPENSTQSYIKQLGKTIFSMVMLGLEKLNVKGDILLQAMIRDIFDQYLPILITEVSSGCNFDISDDFDILLKCFKKVKSEFLRLIFEMLMSNFYNTSSDNIMHKHSNLVRNRNYSFNVQFTMWLQIYLLHIHTDNSAYKNIA